MQRFITFVPKNHALMKNYYSHLQIKIEEFKTDFELLLNQNNRWIILSHSLPWDDLVKPYLMSLDLTRGRLAKEARIVVGALFIKHKLNLSDEEVIETIRENVYMQYFLGLNQYHPEPLFHPSLFVEIRKRMTVGNFDEMNKKIIELASSKEAKKIKGKKEVTHYGHLKIDATVADQYIKYPTDLDLLNQCREWTEKIIDDIYPKAFLEKKPRTYRRVARRAYLSVAKKKNKSKIEIRKAIKKQLSYVKRNLGYINELLDMFENGSFPLCRRSQTYLWVVNEVYRQQKYMYENKTNQCGDRIVSLHQPHVRPIVRGKQGTNVEFGSKLGISLANGFGRIDTLSWDAYNECTDLKSQVEAYKSIHGYYPELVQADEIYFTKENREWLKEKGIRITGKPLGRPPKKKESSYQKKKRKKERNERNHIEGKFGQGKNGYDLNKIRARLKPTSESMIGCIFFVMNVIKLYQDYLN